MANPFYLQEVPTDAPFCNRVQELTELRSYASSKANVVLFSPRRYGKTSLVRRVQKNLAEDGAITIFADLFGVSSVDDVAARLARAVFAVTHSREPLWKTALRAIKSFRPVLKPYLDGGFSLTVEPSSIGLSGMPLLEETMESLGEFIAASESLVHVALDEFQEIVTLKEAPQVEAAMRTRVQRQEASFFFVGSRRRVLVGIFNERRRPFFQSAINYALGPLPEKELIEFVAAQFIGNNRECSREAAGRLVSMSAAHPYYTQKLAFFVYEMAAAVTEDAIHKGMTRLTASEKPVFEAMIQGLPPQQRLLLQALASEPTIKLFAGAYIRRHNLGSVGGVQHSAKQLEDMDLIEREADSGNWRVVDPFFAVWLRGQIEDKIA